MQMLEQSGRMQHLRICVFEDVAQRVAGPDRHRRRVAFQQIWR